jgi:hypothetical protein
MDQKISNTLEISWILGRLALSGVIAVVTAPVWLSGLAIAAVPLGIAYVIYPFKDDESDHNPF